MAKKPTVKHARTAKLTKPLSAKPGKPAPGQAKSRSVPIITSKSVPLSATSSVTIKTKPRNGLAYKALIGHGLLSHPSKELDSVLANRRAALLIVDSGLSPATLEPVIRRLDKLPIRWGVSIARATEEEKTIESLERVLAEASRLRLERSDIIIALGGGIVTDLAGLAASMHRRGIDVIQCPTSLLAMVDAAIGGKTAVNLWVRPDHKDSDQKPRLVKNAVGTFHQPALVICDTSSLASLPPRELRCGLAECLKHALIGPALGDKTLWTWTLKNLDAIMRRDTSVTAELVKRNLECKARIVQADEHESSTKRTGGRVMLNLGHTFAHALETLPALSWRDRAGQGHAGPLKHGEAVGLGLLCAATLSESLKLLKPTNKSDAPISQQLREALERIGLPTRILGLPTAPATTIVQRMRDDKKVAAGRLRIILPTSNGQCIARDDIPDAAVSSALEAIRAG